MKSFIFLFFAIIAEIIATTSLKESQQFTKPIPTIITILGYALAFYLFSFSLKTIPIGIAYAIWSGAGIVLISIIGYFAFKQHLDLPALIGIAFIILGVIIINVFSKSVPH